MIRRIWLTYKQHRFETIAVTVLCLGVAIAALIEAFHVNSVGLPSGCVIERSITYNDGGMSASGECQGGFDRFYPLVSSAEVTIIHILMVLLPFVVGIAFGAPLVAKELEEGTAPLSWALSGSRGRWLLEKVLASVVLIVPLLLAAGLAADVLQGALSPGTDAHASLESYADRGVMVVAWGLLALLVAVALSALLGRTLPAVLVAVVVCALARGLLPAALNATAFSAFAVQGNPNFSSNSYSVNDMYVYNRVYLDGKPWAGDIGAWWNEHLPAAGADATAFDPSQAPQWIPFVIHGDRYWPIVALESGILLLGSLIFGAVALFRVDRRRPY
jgi:ABC-type transport system involved in multi-copper enzyme maturation permease subunit